MHTTNEARGARNHFLFYRKPEVPPEEERAFERRRLLPHVVVKSIGGVEVIVGSASTEQRALLMASRIGDPGECRVVSRRSAVAGNAGDG